MYTLDELDKYKNTILNMDCLDFMQKCPDKYFDLICCDPPYGIDVCKMTLGNGKNKIFRGNDDWDNKRPEQILFDEIFRISKNQIIWGGNYFADMFPPSMGWLFWDKGTGANDFADGELAWTSYNKALRKKFISWVGANAKDTFEREHPTQKPVKLFEWCIEYAKLPEDAIILDCFSGSGTTAIAAHNLKRNFICIEKDYDYWKASVERLENAKAQLSLF